MKYEVGDKVKIIANESCHGFKTGQEVEIIHVADNHYMAKGDNDCWTITDEEIVELVSIISANKVFTKIIDQYNEIIQVGDFITYPIRSGSFLGMRTAKVSKITSRKNHIGREVPILKIITEEGKIGTLECIDRVTVIPKSKIQNSKSSDLIHK